MTNPSFSQVRYNLAIANLGALKEKEQVGEIASEDDVQLYQDMMENFTFILEGYLDEATKQEVDGCLAEIKQNIEPAIADLAQILSEKAYSENKIERGKEYLQLAAALGETRATFDEARYRISGRKDRGFEMSTESDLPHISKLFEAVLENKDTKAAIKMTTGDESLRQAIAEVALMISVQYYSHNEIGSGKKYLRFASALGNVIAKFHEFRYRVDCRKDRGFSQPIKSQWACINELLESVLANKNQIAASKVGVFVLPMLANYCEKFNRPQDAAQCVELVDQLKASQLQDKQLAAKQLQTALDKAELTISSGLFKPRASEQNQDATGPRLTT